MKKSTFVGHVGRWCAGLGSALSMCVHCFRSACQSGQQAEELTVFIWLGEKVNNNNHGVVFF